MDHAFLDLYATASRRHPCSPEELEELVIIFFCGVFCVLFHFSNHIRSADQTFSTQVHTSRNPHHNVLCLAYSRAHPIFLAQNPNKTKCGGHPGEDDVGNWVLLPKAARKLKIPFIVTFSLTNLFLYCCFLNRQTKILANILQRPQK